MVLQKIWVSQNFSQISRVSQSRFFSRFEVSESRFFLQCSEISNVSVSQFKKWESLGLAEKNASLAFSQSLDFTNCHPSNSINYCSKFIKIIIKFSMLCPFQFPESSFLRNVHKSLKPIWLSLTSYNIKVGA